MRQNREPVKNLEEMTNAERFKWMEKRLGMLEIWSQREQTQREQIGGKMLALELDVEQLTRKAEVSS